MSRSLAILIVLAASGSSSVQAQQSASFRLTEWSFNSGGDPRDGVIPTSPGFRVSIDAIGDWIAPGPPASASYSLSGGFVAAYPPPGEVTNLLFLDATTLAWDPEPSVGQYALYAGPVDPAFPSGYGVCLQPPPHLTTETAIVTATPAPGEIWFFLVTARNTLDEEGTKGYTSAGGERVNPAPCP